MKNYIKSFIFLNILVLTLVIVNLIPNSMIYDNLCKSINYYQTTYITQYFHTLSQNDPSADCNELNIIMNIDNKKPLYSSLIAPFYREFDNQGFITMAEKTIMEKEPANYNYNRYWHGYQIIWRPLLILLNAKQIMFLMQITYILLLFYFLYELVKNKYTRFAFGILCMNILYIIPFGFNALEYIPVFFIYLITCILLLKSNINKEIIICCSGIAVAFFDFLTAETLTLTIPLLLYVYIQHKNNSLKYKNCIKLGVSWLIGYCCTFIYKWFLSSILYKKNFFAIAFEKYESHQNPFNRIYSIKININTLFGGILTFNTTFWIFIIVFSMVITLLYLFRKQGSEHYIISILLICTIPYIRYLVIDGHSFGYAWFTYRAQLVLIPAIILLCKEINLKYLRNK